MRKKPSTGQSLFYKNEIEIQEWVGERSHKQFLTIYNSMKLINAYYVALQLDLAALSCSNYFPLVRELTVEITIAILAAFVQHFLINTFSKEKCII